MRDTEDGDRDREYEQEQDQEREREREREQRSRSGSSVASENRQNHDTLLEGQTSIQASASASASVWPAIRQEALIAPTYDIVPTTAAPHSTSINALTATADMRWVFSGGSDGYIRKFNWADSINSKLMLTVAQRHPFVDSVVKAGVLMTYWENMDGPRLSPVYSLASHSQGLWLFSGLESGGIRLQSVRHEEGREIALLQNHTSAVSVLRLTSDEQSLLSGSWDKTVLDWDLNIGTPRRSFAPSVGQVSAIQIRPESSIPVPQESGERVLTNGHFSSSNRLVDSSSFATLNGEGTQNGTAQDQQAPSPTDSLFGGSDSLFGDNDAAGENEAPSGGVFPVEEDDEFSQALPNGIRQLDTQVQDESGVKPEPENVENKETTTTEPDSMVIDEPQPPSPKDLANGTSEPLTNGLPHATEDLPSSTAINEAPAQDAASNVTSDTTFLTASIDGMVRVFDRRQPDPVAKVVSQNAPPWCMSACWSPDGNHIYAGRRNGTVEEFSLHKGFRSPERTFKLPSGSGPVSELQTMPNGRHLIWYDSYSLCVVCTSVLTFLFFQRVTRYIAPLRSAGQSECKVQCALPHHPRAPHWHHFPTIPRSSV